MGFDMLQYDGLVFRDSDNEAYCPTCYKLSGLSIRLRSDQQQIRSEVMKSWYCGVCDQIVEPELMRSFS